MAIHAAIVVAIVLVIIGLFFRTTRLIIGSLLALLGLVVSLTVMALPLGIVTLLIGGGMIYADYIGKKHERAAAAQGQEGETR